MDPPKERFVVPSWDTWVYQLYSYTSPSPSRHGIISFQCGWTNSVWPGEDGRSELSMLSCRSLLWLRLGSGEYSVSLVSVSNVQGDHAGNAIVRIFATHDAIKTFSMQLQVKVVVNPAYTRPKWQCSQHNGDTVSCWYGDYGISNMFTSFAPSLRELSDGWLTLANKVPSCGTMMTPYVSLLKSISMQQSHLWILWSVS